MLTLLLTVTTSVLASIWILFCIGLYVYNYFVESLDLPLPSQSPCSAHANLKALIQKIIAEAAGLKCLTKAEDHPLVENESNYEDLLASAILNRVVQSYQDDVLASSTRTSSRASNSSKQGGRSQEYGFREETLQTKWKNNNNSQDDGTSVSSFDEWTRCEPNASIEPAYYDQNATNGDSINSNLSHVAVDDEEWQDNWCLQRRKFRGTPSPIPVPMLVPNPTTDAKVLIGDREADDTTDLSDAGSDFEDESESAPSMETILINARTVIGGKNAIKHLGDEEIMEDRFASMERDGSGGNAITEAKNSCVTNVEVSEVEPFTSLESNTEQDTEYTEKYGTLPRTILKNVQPLQRDLKTVIGSYMDTCNIEEADHEKKSNDTTEGKETSSLVNENSYSERERKKWKNAVQLENNPYSEENLYRRLNSSSNSSISSLFSPDPHIGESLSLLSKPSSENGNRVAKSDEIASQGEPTSLEDSTFKAIPVTIMEDFQNEHASSTSLELSSDSDRSIERIYNLKTGKMFAKVGSKLFGLERRLEQTNITDENHNSAADVKLVPCLVKKFMEQTIPPPEQFRNVEQESMSLTMDFSWESEEKETDRPSSSIGLCTEILDLRDKQLVKSRLGEFSRSHPNLSTMVPSELNESNDKKRFHLEEHERKSSVNDLKRLFDQGVASPNKTECVKHIYSLTARSIPIQLREHLKNYEDNEDLSISESTPTKTPDYTPPEELDGFPITKSRIYFFEQLKR